MPDFAVFRPRSSGFFLRLGSFDDLRGRVWHAGTRSVLFRCAPVLAAAELMIDRAGGRCL